MNLDEFKLVWQMAGGTFVGAGLAFLSTVVHDDRRRYQENVAAGNLALTSINGMLNEFLLFRLGLYADIADPSRSSNSPIWASVRPSRQSYGSYSIDLKSLSFLFEHRESIDAINAIAHADLAYRDMLEMDKFRNEAAVEIYTECGKNKWNTTIEAEEGLGRQRIETMITAICSVASRARDNEEIFVMAREKLTSALEKRLQRRWRRAPSLIKVSPIAAHFRKENLPIPRKVVLDPLEEFDRKRQLARQTSSNEVPEAKKSPD